MPNNQDIYNDKEFLNMQQEAIKRVNEMKRKARQNLNKTNNQSLKTVSISTQNEIEPQIYSNVITALERDSKGGQEIKNRLSLSSLKKLLNEDNLLIMLLILILYSDKYENKIIILALLYILLDIDFK